MNRLQIALAANAIFSGLSGITAMALNQPIGRLFGTENGTVFLVIGIALVFFACTIGYEIIKQRHKAVIWIIIQDFLWVIGSIVLLIWNPFEISPTGNVIITVIALIVLMMAINQFIALDRVQGA